MAYTLILLYQYFELLQIATNVSILNMPRE